MNQVQSSLIAYIRNATQKDGNRTAARLATLTDEQIARMMFSNYRGRDQTARGVRLTNFGVQMLMVYFQAYEVQCPEWVTFGTAQLLYLDNKAKLPYYVSDRERKIVVFDTELGIKLKLSDGDINTLIEMDSFQVASAR